MGTMRDERLNRGIHLFNTRQFFEAHEVLEDVWRESRGPERRLLQAVIQTAVALHHHSRGNSVGAASLLARAARNLEGYPATFAGLEVAALRTSLDNCKPALTETGLPIPDFKLEENQLAASSSQRAGDKS